MSWRWGSSTYRTPARRARVRMLMIMTTAMVPSMSSVAVVMIMSILTLARRAGVRYVEDPHLQLIRPDGERVPLGYEQDPVIGQLAQTVFHGVPFLFFLVTAATGFVLVL